MEPWNRLPREVVESPSLEIFKPCLAMVLCSLLWVTLLRQGSWAGWPTEFPSTPCRARVLWSRAHRELPPFTSSKGLMGAEELHAPAVSLLYSTNAAVTAHAAAFPHGRVPSSVFSACALGWTGSSWRSFPSLVILYQLFYDSIPVSSWSWSNSSAVVCESSVASSPVGEVLCFGSLRAAQGQGVEISIATAWNRLLLSPVKVNWGAEGWHCSRPRPLRSSARQSRVGEWLQRRGGCRCGRRYPSGARVAARCGI